MSEQKASVWRRLYTGDTAVRIVPRRRLWFLISTAVILLGLVSLMTRGLNFGIDFEGGTAWEVNAPGVSVTEARDALRPLGLGDAKIQVVGESTLRVQASTEEQAETAEVTRKLAELGRTDPSQVNLNEVGPSWGDEITDKARRALVIFLVAITAYISLRFEWKMAVATLAALFHDILVTVGVYSLSGFEVTPATVIALLTILGYSIYDGIVVFDKVDENTRGLAASGRMTYGEMVNLSLNQVLMRSLNTSITALLPILSLLIVGGFILGATTLQDFALALLIGLTASAYSSIFIASPLLALLKEREPRYAGIKERVLARGGTAAPLTPAAAAATLGVGGGADEAASRSPRPTPSTASRPAPRPRKKGKRR
jgi:preprotein translocase subunit SecF